MVEGDRKPREPAISTSLDAELLAQKLEALQNCLNELREICAQGTIFQKKQAIPAERERRISNSNAYP